MSNIQKYYKKGVEAYGKINKNRTVNFKSYKRTAEEVMEN